MSAQPQSLNKGIISALIAALFLSLMNVVAKILLVELDPITISFWRNLIALTILIIGLFVFKKTHLIKTKIYKSHFLRALVGTLGLVTAVWTLSFMPVTEAVVLGFTSPLFVVVLSYPLLREKIGIRRTLATLVGFMGVIFIIGFDQSNITLNGLAVALLWSLSNALVLIMLRQLGKTEQAITTVFYFLLFGLLITGIYIPFSEKIIPSQSLQWAVFAIGIIGALSLIFKSESYRHAPANVIAPLSYTILLWSVFLDYFIWGHISPTNLWIGAIIILGSNLYILWREKKFSPINTNR